LFSALHDYLPGCFSNKSKACAKNAKKQVIENNIVFLALKHQWGEQGADNIKESNAYEVKRRRFLTRKL
tara:strand:+ start:467 stop:673 length:207 start_codon:yes stop_codon:yes gene_type:complete